MHRITPFSDEKFINFLERDTDPPQTHPLAAYGASILASSALDLRPANVPVALTPMTVRNISESLPTRWRRKPAGIDMERNDVTVTLCIAPTLIRGTGRSLRVPTKEVMYSMLERA